MMHVTHVKGIEKNFDPVEPIKFSEEQERSFCTPRAIERTSETQMGNVVDVQRTWILRQRGTFLATFTPVLWRPHCTMKPLMKKVLRETRDARKKIEKLSC